MTRETAARGLFTFILGTGAISSFFLDWRSNHLLSPAWHPHAKFHGALLLFFLLGVSVTSVWLLWRNSKEPQVAFQVAALVSASFWLPFFYVTLLLPSASLWAGLPGRMPKIDGIPYYPNVLTAGVYLVLTAIAYRLGRRAQSRTAISVKNCNLRISSRDLPSHFVLLL